MLLSFGMSFTLSFAAPKVTYFESLTVNDGLSQMSIIDIFQDSRGYMWFATRDGLNRYDGHSFDVFRNVEDDSLSISHNYILSIAEDVPGNLWIGTISGLNYFDGKTETFSRFYSCPEDTTTISNKLVRKIYRDKSNRLWLGTNSGLDLYSPGTKTFRRFLQKEIPDGRINAILEVDDRLLIGTDHHLYIFNPDDGSVKLHPLSAAKSISVKSLYQDSRGNVYAGTFNDGLFELDRLSGVRRQYLKKDGDPSSLSNNSVRCICEDTDGNLLIGTFNGINIFNPRQQSFISFKQESGENNGLLHFSFHSIYCDRDGTVWTGTWAGGVNYFNAGRNNCLEYHIPSGQWKNVMGVAGSMVEDEHGIWIGMEGGGLLHYDIEQNRYTHYAVNESAASNIRSNIVNSIYKQGFILYVATNDGVLACFDTRLRRFFRNIRLPGAPPVLTINGDGHGNLLIGVQDKSGLLLVAPNGEVTDTFYDRKGEKIPFNSISSIIKDTTDTYLLGSNSFGFYRYNFKTKACSFYDIKKMHHHASVNLLHRDRRGWLWIATSQQGVFCLDKDMKLLKQYTMSDGLNSNNICGITEDDKGYIWLSVFSEISRIDAEQQHLKSFKGFKLSEFAFQSCLSTGNRVFFGGNMGFVSFDSERPSINNMPPPVVIKKLLVNNRPVALREHDFLHEETVLDYRHSNITIIYRALNYIHPEETVYAYQLEGFDKSRIQAGNHLEAHYTNLPTGKYRFCVKAANSDGVWNETGASILITVLPPPWKTWWAYLLYLLLFFGLILGYLRYIRMHVRLTNDIKMRRIEQENAEKLHADRVNLFTGFSHELRTPLTLIISPLEELYRRMDLPQQVRESLGLMHRNARRLLLLVNQLMDFRKKESGCMEVRVAEGDFSRFVREIVLMFSELTKSKNIRLICDSRDTPLMLWYDRNLMEKVILNLLSNAFKNTPDGGSIEVRVEPAEEDGKNCLRISVIDSGCGIPDDKLSSIFDPFYQIHRHEDSIIGGTGIGLSLAKGIVELHHGKIRAEHMAGPGAFFQVLLPTGNAHFSTEEIITGYESSEDIAAYTDADASGGEAESPSSRPKSPHTVLIVEDNGDLRKYIRSRLSGQYRVLEAVDGKEACTLAVNHLPDLVVSDIMMPGMDGIQLCRSLKQDLRTGHIPVVLLTARSTVMQIEEGLKIGADDYITKPFNVAHLLLRISNLIASREHLKSIYGKNFITKDIGSEITSADDRFLQKLYRVMEENISNPELNIKKFCREIGMSKTNLYHKIKSLTNLSPTEFARHTRLQYAAKLLKSRKASVSEVYVLAGFNSHSYFSSCFRAVYGVSPSEYARKEE
jgi:signal transduction histidine kinase/ligand-binding sensor domain-containing protein/DNA-binding response OmpR family regulator